MLKGKNLISKSFFKITVRFTDLQIYKKNFFLTKKVFNFDTLSHIVSKAEMRNTLYRKSTMEINQISRIR